MRYFSESAKSHCFSLEGIAIIKHTTEVAEQYKMYCAKFEFPTFHMCDDIF